MALVDFKLLPGIDKQQTQVGADNVGLILTMLDLDMVFQKKWGAGLLY